MSHNEITPGAARILREVFAAAGVELRRDQFGVVGLVASPSVELSGGEVFQFSGSSSAMPLNGGEKSACVTSATCCSTKSVPVVIPAGGESLAAGIRSARVVEATGRPGVFAKG